MLVSVVVSVSALNVGIGSGIGIGLKCGIGTSLLSSLHILPFLFHSSKEVENTIRILI